MIQVYYSIEDNNLPEFKELISKYQGLIKELYNKKVTNKTLTLQEKNNMQKKIQELLQQSDVLGFLVEGEFDKFDILISDLKDNELKTSLTSNILEKENLENTLVKLSQEKESDIKDKIMFFIKKAVKESKSIVIWIM